MSGDESDRLSTLAASPRSRRQYLTSLTALGTVALAGCSSGGDSAGSDDDGDSGDNGDRGGTDTDDGTPATGASGGGCPSLPLSYTAKRTGGSPSLAFEGPAEATYPLLSEGTGGVVSAEVSYPRANDGESWFVQLAGVRQDEPTVAEAVAADSFAENFPEVTSDYDLADDRTRVFGLARQSSWEVYLPGAPVVQVGVTPMPGLDNVACPDAATATVDRLIETLAVE